MPSRVETMLLLHHFQASELSFRRPVQSVMRPKLTENIVYSNDAFRFHWACAEKLVLWQPWSGVAVATRGMPTLQQASVCRVYSAHFCKTRPRTLPQWPTWRAFYQMKPRHIPRELPVCPLRRTCTPCCNKSPCRAPHCSHQVSHILQGEDMVTSSVMVTNTLAFLGFF
jgi:hypothetical protein